MAYCCSPPPEALFAKLSHAVNTCQTYTKVLPTLRTWSKNLGLCLGLPAPLCVSLPGAIVVSPLVVFARGHDGVGAPQQTDIPSPGICSLSCRSCSVAWGRRG